MLLAHRYHDFSCGHRVVGHEGKCINLHGHNYRVTFHCEAPNLDDLGRVIDFSVIKQKLCMWVEDNWDHRMLLWEDDPWLEQLSAIDPTVTAVPFNPTAEEMANHLLQVVGPKQLSGSGVTLIKVDLMETRKCGVTVTLE